MKKFWSKVCLLKTFLCMGSTTIEDLRSFKSLSAKVEILTQKKLRQFFDTLCHYFQLLLVPSSSHVLAADVSICSDPFDV